MKKPILIFIGFGIAAASAFDKLERLEGVYDIDLGFLKRNPELAWGMDPFERIPGFAQINKDERAPRLEGVFFNARHPSALIDGEEYDVGDEIGSRKIAEIGKNYVLLERGDSLIELTIPPGPQKQPAIEIREHTGRTR